MESKRKITVALLFGGKSAEHEVSVRSAKNVYNALDKNKYEIVLIGIEGSGRWQLIKSGDFIKPSFKRVEVIKNNIDLVSILPGGGGFLQSGNLDFKVDVIFPVLHGTYGEDGTVQGLLTIAEIPFVGPGVLGSAVGMDKDVTKRLLRDAHLPVGKFLVYRKADEIRFTDIKNKLGLPFFVKPANLGSSIGISKVNSEDDYNSAIQEAFKFDSKIIIEEFIKGKEIECSVLGNETLSASVPGEIIPTHDFYDYDAKYLDDNGAKMDIPAKIPPKKIKEIQNLAISVFKTLCLEGMSRVDFFMTDSGKVFVNEVNTIPGFTNISMYPKLWEASGLSYSDLIDRLISLAIERFEAQNKLKTTI